MRTDDDDDREYYNRRAEAEIEAASATENPAACRAHYQMAELYLERAYCDDDGAWDGAGDGAASGGAAGA